MSELTTLFKNTADAIRSKTGDTATMKASQFPAKIQGISVGISQDEADARYLQLSGGTMTGDLILNGAPTADNQAATKAYVDAHGGSGGSSLIYTKTVTTTADKSRGSAIFETDSLLSIIDPLKPIGVEITINGGFTINASDIITWGMGFHQNNSATQIFEYRLTTTNTHPSKSYTCKGLLIPVGENWHSGQLAYITLMQGAYSIQITNLTLYLTVVSGASSVSLTLKSGATITLNLYQ